MLAIIIPQAIITSFKSKDSVLKRVFFQQAQYTSGFYLPLLLNLQATRFMDT